MNTRSLVTSKTKTIYMLRIMEDATRPVQTLSGTCYQCNCQSGYLQGILNYTTMIYITSNNTHSLLTYLLCSTAVLRMCLFLSESSLVNMIALSLSVCEKAIDRLRETSSAFRLFTLIGWLDVLSCGVFTVWHA